MSSSEWWVDTAEEAFEGRNLKAATAAALIAISKVLGSLVEDLMDEDEDDHRPWGKRAGD